MEHGGGGKEKCCGKITKILSSSFYIPGDGFRLQHRRTASMRAVETLPVVMTGEHPLLYVCKNYLVAS